MAVDFLPICDLLFNFISVASYFCDVAFDVIVAYTFYRDGETTWFLIVVSAIIVSLFACQTLSIKWYVEDEEHEGQTALARTLLYTIHGLQCGVLWRYAKLLFLPMASAIPLVKREMRNLCVLRMIHGFCQAMTFLLVQGYMAATRPKAVGDVHYVSTALSLFSICWALASFNKNIRPQNIDRLVLTWIGVIFQLLWRLGTVTSRCLALVIYASAFDHWIFLVVALHWLSMFLWLAFQHHREYATTKTTKTALIWSFVLSYIYIFSYINVEERARTKVRVAMYYTVTVAENVLLVSLWTTSVRASLDFDPQDRRNLVVTVVLLFFAGIAFMLVYYRLFHTSKISSQFAADNADETRDLDRRRKGSDGSQGGDKLAMASMEHQAVFNCVLNPALKKKKKIPSVLPPPPVVNGGAKSSVPFWKEPLPTSVVTTTKNNTPVQQRATTPLADIRQKLQTKRDNQLRQLHKIESEIRAGHIQRPPNWNGFGHVHHHIQDPGPGLKKTPYVYIHNGGTDSHNDSSGDQGDVDSGDDMQHRYRPQPTQPPPQQQLPHPSFRKRDYGRHYETPL